MTYDASAVAAYYDRLGRAELDRFESTLGDRISLALHTEALKRFAAGASRVLDVGAGPGRFTEILHQLGCRVVVADISAAQLELNREAASARGFASSVEGWHQLDICDLGMFDDESFDAVVAFGGPLSYALEHRDRAVTESYRVLRPGGCLILSVMSLWGTMHRHLRGVLSLPLTANRTIIETGDLTADTNPNSSHHCHMYRSGELRALLESHGMEILLLSASSALTTGQPVDMATIATMWDAVLEFEREACVQPGYLDAGTHLISVARRTHA